MPIVVSWDTERNRYRPLWKPLTVTERSRVCGPDVAFAIRISWGRSDHLLIYRSLTNPTLRAVLGRPTAARFLIGTINEEGNVRPLIEIMD